MEDEGGGSGGHGHSWLGRRQSNKRNFSTMSASHRDESPDSLFLPSSTPDPHYENEHAARRRRIQARPDERARERSLHYPGDGLDYRRPVMSTSARQSSVGTGRASSTVPAPPAAQVIDLTDENEGESEGGYGGRSEAEVTGTSDGAVAGSSSRAGGGQRLPRFGRDVIDVEENEARSSPTSDFQSGSFTDQEGLFDQLPGANYLALPPRRSAAGRVQYSTLRRPTRPPSPPQEMDDGEIEYIGSRSYASVQERRPTPGPAPNMNFNGPRSVTPFPTGLNEPIDLTAEPDDEVLFVDERRRPGVNLEQPNGNAGNRTQVGEHGGFGIGRLANILRDGGAAIGGRLAQRVHDFNGGYAGMNLEQLQARRAQLEEQTRAMREERDQRRRELALGRDITTPRRRPGPARVRRVHMNPDGTIPGYQRVGWFGGPAPGDPPAAPQGGAAVIGNIGGMMDYGMAAFDMGFGRPEANRPPTPKYSPPPEPEKGFTRNPGEDDVVVCPNCGDELAVGEEESKQEIWVNKACGHAYCGTCAQHRARSSRSKKGKARAADVENLPPPFKACVVEGCNKSTSGKAMVRVYFGS